MNPILIITIISFFLFPLLLFANEVNKEALRLKSKEMFFHAFDNYMKFAYPADELMPLSCKGRYRGVEPSRGDVDDILGNFSLTLIDSLDTIFIMGEFGRFESSVKLVIDNVKFDTNVTVSVFEVNIRIIGGLLGAHVASLHLQEASKLTKHPNCCFMGWYKNELLSMAEDVARRLLPAFDTPTGIPYPRINLRYGGSGGNVNDVSTCTACAGTIILEFAALSRMTGNPIYEQKASKAMTYLWEQRNRFSNLMGTIINIFDGNWMRKESGVGAGIDSYYEYLLKAYVMLGDDTYLHRFNTHYNAIKRYISTAELSSLPLFLDVKMHEPLQRVKNFMDSLLAFWPGLQVLFGDVKQAVAFHEILSQVMKRHSFLPEAFTTDFHIYWGHHLLRPEFIESNYFLYHSTGDPYYLDIGTQVLNNLETHARVKCGFAAIEDVRTMNHSDQLDSFVLAETFKYLYLLFAEPSQLPLNLYEFIFTTEGHILPLNLALSDSNEKVGNFSSQQQRPTQVIVDHLTDKKQHSNKKSDSISSEPQKNNVEYNKSCENHMYNADAATIVNWVFLNFPNDSKPIYKSPGQHLAALIREPLKDIVIRGGKFPDTKVPLLPKNFIPNNPEHVNLLKKMGIQIHYMNDGRLQLFHQPNMAESDIWSSIGETFMTEMIKLTQNSGQSIESRFISLIINNSYIIKVLKAAPAQFGKFPSTVDQTAPFHREIILADPYNSCSVLSDKEIYSNKIVVTRRGDCMFIEKARLIQKTGAVGAIIIDNNRGSSFDTSALFSMSGDGRDDIEIPVVFLFDAEAQILFNFIEQYGIANLSAIFTQTSPDFDAIGSYLNANKEKAKTSETTQSKQTTEIQKKARSLLRVRITKRPEQSEIDDIFKIDKVTLKRIESKDHPGLDQFLLNFQANEQLSVAYDQFHTRPESFYKVVEQYLLNNTNIAELELKSAFLNIIKWALLFGNSSKQMHLPDDCCSVIETLSYVSTSLSSLKFRNLVELAMPSITSHLASFDLHIYIPDDCQLDSHTEL